MARSHDSERYNLSDAEKRELIEQGKPLPEKYRFLLLGTDRVRLPDAEKWSGVTGAIPLLAQRARVCLSG